MDSESEKTPQSTTPATDGMEKKKLKKKPTVKFSDQAEQTVDATILVLPPLSLTNEVWKEIKARYNVIEVMKFNTSLIN